jgi:hypothetical protein
MKIVERTYISRNGVVEKTRFLVGDRTRTFTGKRTGKRCSLKKQGENDRLAIRRLARILNCNYAHKDLLLTLTYSDEGMKAIRGKTEEERRTAAEHQCALWLRRLKRKNGGDAMLSVSVTSNMDGETGELVRLHHHVVLPAGVSWDEIQALWRLGDVDIREIRQQDDLTPIAAYMLRQVRRVPEKKKYRCSRGMEQPKIEERMVLGQTEIRVQPGAKVLERQYAEENISQYVRYKRREGKRRDELEGIDGHLPVLHTGAGTGNRMRRDH